MKRSLSVLAFAALLGIAWLGWRFVPMLNIGAGYLAKTLRSEYFVAGRTDPESILADIRDIEPAFKWVSYRLDRAAGRASGYVGPGLAATTAVYREGVGCTIAKGIDADALEPLPLALAAGVPPGKPFAVLPRNPALELVLDEAFREPTPTSHRQTRAIVVLHRDAIAAERYAPGFGRDTPLIGSSMTKSITNNLVGFLVADGLLELDAPAPAAPHGEYGAQFWLNAGKNGEHHAFTGLPPNVFFANGFNDQIVAVFPDQEIVVVRLGFTTDNSWNNTEFLGRVLAVLD